MPIRVRLRRSWRGDIIYIMKNLLYVFIISIISFFLFNESKSALPNVMLKCENISGSKTQKIFRTNFYNVNGNRGVVDFYWFDEFATGGVKARPGNTFNLIETEDLKYLIFESRTDHKFDKMLDRETLILVNALKPDSNIKAQCIVLDESSTLAEYVESHRKIVQERADVALNEQMDKNKI